MSHVRFRKVLVAGQVAFTVLLLAGACLFTRTLWNLRTQNIGLNPDHVIVFSVAPSLNGYDSRRTVTLIDQMRERFATLPGVRAVASSELPILTGTDMGGNITVEGGEKIPDEVNHVQTDSVSPGYFSTLGIPLRRRTRIQCRR